MKTSFSLTHLLFATALCIAASHNAHAIKKEALNILVILNSGLYQTNNPLFIQHQQKHNKMSLKQTSPRNSFVDEEILDPIYMPSY